MPAHLDADGAVVLDDPQALKVLAHPARALAIRRLFEGDPLTATQLAAEAGVMASAMSYHLRELERWGVAVRDEGAADGRERPWRAAGRSLNVEATAIAGDRVQGAAWIGTFMGRLSRQVAAAVDDVMERPEPDRVRMASSTLYLTPDEYAAVSARFDEMLAPYRKPERTPARHPEGAERYEAWWFLLPEAPDADAGSPGAS